MFFDVPFYTSMLPHSMFPASPHFSVWVKVLQGIEIIVSSRPHEKECQSQLKRRFICFGKCGTHMRRQIYLCFFVVGNQKFVFQNFVKVQRIRIQNKVIML